MLPVDRRIDSLGKWMFHGNRQLRGVSAFEKWIFYRNRCFTRIGMCKD